MYLPCFILGPRDFQRVSLLDRGLIGEHWGTGKSGDEGCSQQAAVESRERVSLTSLQKAPYGLATGLGFSHCVGHLWWEPSYHCFCQSGIGR